MFVFKQLKVELFSSLHLKQCLKEKNYLNKKQIAKTQVTKKLARAGC